VEKPYRPPLSVSRPALLRDGSDATFRRLVNDLLTVSARMQLIRDGFGAIAGLSGPQYSLVMAIARLQGADGVSVNGLAEALHVSGPFVTAETGKLKRRGLIAKRVNPADRRGVLVTLTASGRRLVEDLSGTIRAVNDVIFRDLDAARFAALGAMVARLVDALADAHDLQQRLRAPRPRARSA
jgi:MarR family transcriptional regulator, organic hydroperoxide resistance regulator